MDPGEAKARRDELKEAKRVAQRLADSTQRRGFNVMVDHRDAVRDEVLSIGRLLGLRLDERILACSAVLVAFP